MRMILLLMLLALAGCGSGSGSGGYSDDGPRKQVTLCTTAFNMLVCEQD